eukprot:XP_022260097.1 uncharacterized protein LOC111090452 [Canis lupus familiaris]
MSRRKGCSTRRTASLQKAPVGAIRNGTCSPEGPVLPRARLWPGTAAETRAGVDGERARQAPGAPLTAARTHPQGLRLLDSLEARLHPETRGRKLRPPRDGPPGAQGKSTEVSQRQMANPAPTPTGTDATQSVLAAGGTGPIVPRDSPLIHHKRSDFRMGYQCSPQSSRGLLASPHICLARRVGRPEEGSRSKASYPPAPRLHCLSPPEPPRSLLQEPVSWTRRATLPLTAPPRVGREPGAASPGTGGASAGG